MGKLWISPSLDNSVKLGSVEPGYGFRMPTDEDMRVGEPVASLDIDNALRMPTDEDMDIKTPTAFAEKMEWLSALVEKGKTFDKNKGYALEGGSMMCMFDELWEMINEEKDSDMVYVIESFELFENIPLVDVRYTKYTINEKIVDDKRRRGF